MNVTKLGDRLLQNFRRNRGGISKLGNRVYTWSVPCFKTCPGKTPWCSGPRPGKKLPRCYAHRSEVIYPEVLPAWRQNYRWSRLPYFTEALTSALSRLDECFLRIHVGGDFHSADYLWSWTYALQANPQVHGWSYTKSFASFFFHQQEKTHPWLFWSYDPTTPLSWYPENIRKAWSKLETEPPPFPAFRCLAQKKKGVTCQDCGYCIGWRLRGKQIVPLKETKKNVWFIEH